MIIIAPPPFSEKWGLWDMVSPVADSDSRDQERRGDNGDPVRLKEVAGMVGAQVRDASAGAGVVSSADVRGIGGSVNVVHVDVIDCNGGVDFKYCSRIINVVMKC